MAISEVKNNCNTEIEKATELEEKGQKKETKAYKNAKEYSEYLNDKYSSLRTSDGYSATIAPDLLAKAATDEKTAQWLEYNLKLLPDVIDKIYENTAKGGGRVVSCNVSFDGYDSMTTQVHSVCEADPGTEETKKLVEESRKRNKERREQQEKLLEKSKEKKQIEEEKLENLHSRIFVTDSTEGLLNKVENIEFNNESMISGISIDIRR